MRHGGGRGRNIHTITTPYANDLEPIFARNLLRVHLRVKMSLVRSKEEEPMPAKGRRESGLPPCPFCGSDVGEGAVKCPSCLEWIRDPDADLWDIVVIADGDPARNRPWIAATHVFRDDADRAARELRDVRVRVALVPWNASPPVKHLIIVPPNGEPWVVPGEMPNERFDVLAERFRHTLANQPVALDNVPSSDTGTRTDRSADDHAWVVVYPDDVLFGGIRPPATPVEATRRWLAHVPRWALRRADIPYRGLVAAMLVFVMLGLGALAGWVFAHALGQILTPAPAVSAPPATNGPLAELEAALNPPVFIVRLTDVLNAALLIVIIVELIETVYQQARYKERLYPALVRNFLVIGIVSGVRHLLTTGAQLSLISTQDQSQQPQLVRELLVTAIVVLLLTSGLWLAHRSNPPERPARTRVSHFFYQRRDGARLRRPPTVAETIDREQ